MKIFILPSSQCSTILFPTPQMTGLLRLQEVRTEARLLPSVEVRPYRIGPVAGDLQRRGTQQRAHNDLLSLTDAP